MIDELSTDDDYNYGSISENVTDDIQDGIQIHLYINAKYDRLKIRDGIEKTQN